MADISKIAVSSDSNDYTIKDIWARQHMVKIDDEDQIIDGWKNFIDGIIIGGAENGKKIKYTAATSSDAEQIDFGEPVEIPAHTDLQTGEESNEHNTEEIPALTEGESTSNEGEGEGESASLDTRTSLTAPSTVWNFNGVLKVNGYEIASTNDINPTQLVGRKYKVNNETYGEIVGDYTNNVAMHPQSFVAGINNISSNVLAPSGTNTSPTNQFVCGYYNNNQSNNLFEIGNGADGARSNAFSVDKDGNVRCGQHLYINSNSNNPIDVTQQFTESVISYYMPDYNETDIVVTGGITPQTEDGIEIFNLNSRITPWIGSRKALCICTIPLSLNKDGNVTLIARCHTTDEHGTTANPKVYEYTQYLTEGNHILTFGFLLASCSDMLRMGISTSYNENTTTDSANNHSKIRIFDAKVAAIENYINNLGSYTPTYDITVPTVTISWKKVPRVYFFGSNWGEPLEDPVSPLTEPQTGETTE